MNTDRLESKAWKEGSQEPTSEGKHEDEAHWKGGEPEKVAGQDYTKGDDSGVGMRNRL